jgi:hypothetical protein
VWAMTAMIAHLGVIQSPLGFRRAALAGLP